MTPLRPLFGAPTALPFPVVRAAEAHPSFNSNTNIPIRISRRPDSRDGSPSAPSSTDPTSFQSPNNNINDTCVHRSNAPTILRTRKAVSISISRPHLSSVSPCSRDGRVEHMAASDHSRGLSEDSDLDSDSELPAYPRELTFLKGGLGRCRSRARS
jgi:hypothetical protein